MKSLGIVPFYDFTFGLDEQDALDLDCGKKLYPVNIRYETYGTLNHLKNNAILIIHALTGNAHAAGYSSEKDSKPGWWDEMIGPGKPFDTDKYFIVCSNCIGGCSGSTGPRSLNPKTGKKYNFDFPFITIPDMVRAQFRLMRHLNIPKWLNVAGGSMGGMQALQWAVDYPDYVESVSAIATCARLSSQSIAFNWVGRDAIMKDPVWVKTKGNYENEVPESGLSIARMLAHITYLSDESMSSKFGRKLQEKEKYSFDFTKNFEVESYLEYQGQRFVERFDANCYLYITRAMDYFDLAEKNAGNLTECFSKIKAKFLVVSFSSDWLFSPSNSRDIVRALRANNKDVVYCNIDSKYGHDAFLLEVDTLGTLLADYLEGAQKEAGRTC